MQKFILTLTALLLSICYIYSQHDHGNGGNKLVNAEFDNCKQFHLNHENVRLFWTLNSHSNNITFRVEFSKGGNGWAAIGFNKAKSGMPNSHIVMGYYRCEKPNINEYLVGEERALPKKKHHNMFLPETFTVVTHMDHFIMTFGRKLWVNNSDSHQFFNINNETISILLAFNNMTKPENDTYFTKHTAAGVWEMNLYDQGFMFINEFINIKSWKSMS